jgi:hypothetical protein
MRDFIGKALVYSIPILVGIISICFILQGPSNHERSQERLVAFYGETKGATLEVSRVFIKKSNLSVIHTTDGRKLLTKSKTPIVSGDYFEVKKVNGDYFICFDSGVCSDLILPVEQT